MTTSKLTRRVALAAAGSALMFAAAPAMAADGNAEKVAAAVEALRTAMFAGDGKALAALTLDQLAYSHSNGRTEDKAAFIKSLDGKKAFKALELSDHAISVTGDLAIARHTFDAINNLPDNKTNTAHIRVMQVWKLDGGNWKLFARASAPLPN